MPYPNSYRALAAVAVVVLLSLFALVASAPPEPPLHRNLKKIPPALLEEILIPTSERERDAVDVDPALLGEEAQGEQEVIVQLKSPPVSAMGPDMSPVECMAYKNALQEQQSSFMNRCEAPSAKEVGSLQVLLNAVFLQVDAQEVEALAADPEVVSIHRVTNFEKSLERRVPYVGATRVQEDFGFNGTGIRIAILDSGIDYTHAELGGEGTREAYDAAYKDFTSRDGLFPTEKVVEGYDFVGEEWPDDGPRTQDDDPIDFDGHGTHCADIAAGLLGVAPGASLLAVKVCSAIGPSCSGVALLQGIEYATDPNGDGDPSDHVDIINLSLGSRYGQPFHDDLSQAVEAASALGVLSVAAAGNGRDRPYVVNTPASVLSALAVAQTLIPPDNPSQFLNVDGKDYVAIFQEWSEPLVSTITGPLQFGDGQGGNVDGCEPFTDGSLNGKVVLVDRGNCKFTLKISHIVNGGGVAGIIGLIDDSRPFDSADGGDRPVNIPAYMISLEDSDAIKASSTAESIATLDPENTAELPPSQMASSSSRGPQNDSRQLIKPEIGAPGGSVSANVGSGTGRGRFGGTSAASPVVAGAAALLLQAYPDLTPAEAKARLMNSGETNVIVGDELAPITRLGGGDLRVDHSVTARAAAWDMDNMQGALSFGFIDVDKKQHTLFKRIMVRNYSNETILYSLTPTFRYADDELSGAVQVSTNFPGKLQLLPGQDRFVSIVMTIFAERLPDNNMNSGREGDNSTALSANEYDGYLILDDGVQPISMPWHVLPRKAANITFDETTLDFTEENPTTVNMYNLGGGTAQINTFSLIALSENIPEGGPGEEAPTPDIRAVGINSFEVDSDTCPNSGNSSFIWAFAISSWERTTHLVNVRYDIYIDVDRDGSSDYVVLNSDFDGARERTDGRQVSLVINRKSGRSSRVFFAEHSMNTANTILYICAEQIGLSAEDLNSTNIDIRSIRARDFRFGGPGDRINDLVVTPGAERYEADPVDLGPYQNGSFPVIDRGPFDGNTPEYGLMVISNADRGAGTRGGATQDSELRMLLA